jgi:hypothetical protein
MNSFARTALAVVLLTAAPACNSGSSTTIVEPVATGTLTLTLTPSSALVAPGAVGSVGLGLTRSGGFAGAVQLSASGVPAGVSLTFGSSTLPDGTFSTSVNVSVAASVAASSTPIAITITATGGGVTSPAITFNLRTA